MATSRAPRSGHPRARRRAGRGTTSSAEDRIGPSLTAGEGARATPPRPRGGGHARRDKPRPARTARRAARRAGKGPCSESSRRPRRAAHALADSSSPRWPGPRGRRGPRRREGRVTGAQGSHRGHRLRTAASGRSRVFTARRRVRHRRRRGGVFSTGRQGRALHLTGVRRRGPRAGATCASARRIAVGPVRATPPRTGKGWSEWGACRDGKGATTHRRARGRPARYAVAVGFSGRLDNARGDGLLPAANSARG